ncbi:unnamed protein product [Onchocerca ochengi]|uniref:Ovule protein n=1 Tax=Onchocerca ochengi TaxID=42157 RepID=A0A182EVP5_ONCOC|nr:unnamed protein product [Onchocerca ochengi]
MSGKFGTLTQHLVHSTASFLLTKNGLLGTHIQCLCFIQASKTSYSLKSLRIVEDVSYPEGNFRGTSY